MIVGSTRSGLVEAVHPVVVAAVDPSGRVIEIEGDDADRPFFYRSAVKPIQAAVSQRLGAGLGPEQLALASASHGGQPVHAAIATEMLSGVGLDESHLLCPPDRPSTAEAAQRLASRGGDTEGRLLHNCSGKHAAMLRASVTRGWSLEYTDPMHPLQQEIVEYATEIVGARVTPTGVDGCGVPTMRGDIVGLARAFARLATDPELRPIAENSARFASLTSDAERAEAVLSRWFPAAVKGGAMGCIGVAWLDGSIGFAAKCWTGQGAPAMVGLIEMIDRMGMLPSHPRSQLMTIAAPRVLGGGEPVGALEILR
ncbi:MAG TPA: asparaginase [Acidimicrobiia bacterium]|nr:asparaginase [Acidimicrobiia bacterium]